MGVCKFATDKKYVKIKMMHRHSLHFTGVCLWQKPVSIPTTLEVGLYEWIMISFPISISGTYLFFWSLPISKWECKDFKMCLSLLLWLIYAGNSLQKKDGSCKGIEHHGQLPAVAGRNCLGGCKGWDGWSWARSLAGVCEGRSLLLNPDMCPRGSGTYSQSDKAQELHCETQAAINAFPCNINFMVRPTNSHSLSCHISFWADHSPASGAGATQPALNGTLSISLSCREYWKTVFCKSSALWILQPNPCMPLLEKWQLQSQTVCIRNLAVMF